MLKKAISPKGSDFSQWHAKDSLGGAILLGYEAAADATNVAFKNNSAESGGAIYVGISANCA